MLWLSLFHLTSYCSVPFEKIDVSIRNKYEIVPYYKPNHYSHVQHLKHPYERYVATFGKGGSLHDYGEFTDPRTAALVSLYALKTNKNMENVYKDLGLITEGTRYFSPNGTALLFLD
tara:strand:+ start:1004 stop:1354 length:351 start_codon:yes stop_codon:yes gene_type:complete